jgi:8-oxo-dGTP pyrophosphatase MutT (NUDIX family)
MAHTTVPRPAATTLVVRDLAGQLQVVMLRRSLSASFMPGSYVFPGGALDAEDASARIEGRCLETRADASRRIDVAAPARGAALAFMVAALRECFEECGLWLGAGADVDLRQLADARHRMAMGTTNLGSVSAELGQALATTALAPWSHWVTPIDVAKRFDTIFFVALAPPVQEPLVDAGEAIRAVWVNPTQALTLHAAGELPLEFATRHTLESLRPFDTSASLMQAARSPRHIRAIHPRVARTPGGERMVLLPSDAAYADVMRLDPEGTGTAVVAARDPPVSGRASPTPISTL